MKVLDWGPMQLARKKGWEAALLKLRTESDLAAKDFRLTLGTSAQHPHAVLCLVLQGQVERSAASCEVLWRAQLARHVTSAAPYQWLPQRVMPRTTNPIAVNRRAVEMKV